MLGVAGFEFRLGQQLLWLKFCCFPQCLQVHSGMIPRLCNNRFLSNNFQLGDPTIRRPIVQISSESQINQRNTYSRDRNSSQHHLLFCKLRVFSLVVTGKGISVMTITVKFLGHSAGSCFIAFYGVFVSLSGVKSRILENVTKFQAFDNKTNKSKFYS